MRNRLENWFNATWYARSRPPFWLVPFEWLYKLLLALRSVLFRSKVLGTWRAPVPVIVIGNLTVGGTGKTPLALHLARRLGEKGWRPGLVSRGYGISLDDPLLVEPDDVAAIIGDEPMLLARESGCPVAVFPKRAEAARLLLEKTDCNLLICDDGLQHLALERDVELLVIDGLRRFGNGHCIPAGPLRESTRRVGKVDFAIQNGGVETSEFVQMNLVPVELVNIMSRKSMSLDEAAQRKWHAVAGIGNPDRFALTLKEVGIDAKLESFPDHHAFVVDDFATAGDKPVLMTAKDAVKCESFAGPDWWYLRVLAEFPSDPIDRIDAMLRSTTAGAEDV